jgi:hypothetical protein
MFVVRLRIVLSALAVMVASPIVAFSGTGPEGAAGDPAAPDELDAAATPPRPSAATVATAADASKRGNPVRRTARRPAKVEHAETTPAASQISVDCGQDMCVIQNGLEVTVMAGRSRDVAP